LAAALVPAATAIVIAATAKALAVAARYLVFPIEFLLGAGSQCIRNAAEYEAARTITGDARPLVDALSNVSRGGQERKE
jgi:hypothetical protein